VSRGNAEQPSAQTPKDPGSPNRVETALQGRPDTGVQNRSQTAGPPERPQQPNGQRTPEVNNRNPQNSATGPPDRKPTAGPGTGPTGKPPEEEHKSSNGRSSREEQLTTTRTSAAAVDRGSGRPQAPGGAPRPQPPPSGGPRPAAPTSSGSQQPKQAPKQAPTPQGQPTQQQPQAKTASQNPNAGAQTQPRPTTPSSPADPGAPTARPEASGAVPVWDPPAPQQRKESLFARLGFGKKTDRSESDSAVPAVQQVPGSQPPIPQPVMPPSPQAGTSQTAGPQAPPSQAAAPQARTPLQQRPGTQPSPPAGQGTAAAAPPSSSQPSARTEETTGRTPRVPGNAPPATVPPAPGQQARMPTPSPTGTPGPFPMPAPVQAFKDANTQTNPAIPAAPEAGTPEAQLGGMAKVGVARRTRKARLRLSRLDPWSVMKTSFLFSIAAGIMLVAAVYSIWAVLSTSQLFESVNEIVRSVVSTPGDTTPFRIQEYINTQKVMGVTALIACVDVVIFTALATLGSFLYNLAATMLGGLEITLAED